MLLHVSDSANEASGAWWMNHGIEVALRGDFQGAAFRLDRK
jgi:alpha-galactosidase